MKFRKTFFRLWPKICELLKNERPRFFSIEINIIWFYDTWFWIVSLKTILWYLNWFELRWMAGMYVDKNASKRRVMCIKHVCFPSVWIEPSKISWQQCKRKSIQRKGPRCPQKWSLHNFLSRNGNLHHLSKFKLPSVKEQVWVPINSMFWVTPSNFQQKEPLNFVLRQPAMFWRSCKSCLNVSNFL